MLRPVSKAADQLKAFPEALKRAAGISAKVYNEQNGDYWLKYYVGTREQDKAGNQVELGGSAVNNLNDNLCCLDCSRAPITTPFHLHGVWKHRDAAISRSV